MTWDLFQENDISRTVNSSAQSPLICPACREKITNHNIPCKHHQDKDFVEACKLLIECDSALSAYAHQRLITPIEAEELSYKCRQFYEKFQDRHSFIL